MKFIKWILILVGGAVVLVVGGVVALSAIGGFAVSKQEADDRKATSASVSSGAAIRVSAIEFALDYSSNEVGADLKYKDKPVLIVGTVVEIAKDVLDEPYIMLAPSILVPEPSVRAAILKEQANRIAKLRQR